MPDEVDGVGVDGFPAHAGMDLEKEHHAVDV